MTAKEIAKQVGIIVDKTADEHAAEKMIPISEVDIFDFSAVVINGEQLETFTEVEWNKLVIKKQIVFSRTSPQQKLMIVERFQKNGHIVAVTGDGVNV